MTEENPVDPELKEYLDNVPAEDPFVTEYMTQGNKGSDQTLNFLDKWFPDKDEWKGKTDISAKQAHALAASRHLPKFFEELEDIAPIINAITDDYEKYLTSIEGESREQQVEILRTLFGGLEADESESRSDMLTAFAAKMDDGNE